MYFRDRREAGRQLASLMSEYLNREGVVILGLPRGGVETAYEISHALKLPLDIVSPRKIGAPENPELAIGAVTETGEDVFNEDIIRSLGISRAYLTSQLAKETQKAKDRLEMYRRGLPPRNIKDKVVILVDDGIATGATMLAAVKSVKHEGATKVIVAIPVGPRDTIEHLSAVVDQIICLYTPEPFGAVGYYYENFSQVDDQEVIELLKKAHDEFISRV
jgi:putative phosphoribosyl transferase